MTDVKIFNSPKFGGFRAMRNEKDEPLFCLNDVCDALGLSISNVLARLELAPYTYQERLNQGYRLGCDIYGCIEKEDCVLVTFTHFFSNTKTFGRTYLTNIGHSIKKGTYIL